MTKKWAMPILYLIPMFQFMKWQELYANRAGTLGDRTALASLYLEQETEL